MFEWNAEKADVNFRKHGVRFAESLPVFEDDFAVTIADDVSDPDERRFVSIGIGAKHRVPVVVYCYREKNIRIISVRQAETHERLQYQDHR